MLKLITLAPTQALGYLCGLVIGDGFLNRTKSGNYNICLESTKLEITELFYAAAKSVCTILNPIVTRRNKTRRFPNGKTDTSLMYRTTVSSKVLYEAIKNHKQRDYHWTIPSFLTSDESLIGFLQGLFDAEGCVFCEKERRYGLISIASKHGENLGQVKELLDKLEIRGRIYFHPTQKYFMLHIRRIPDIQLFAKFIGFRINRKRLKLEELTDRLMHGRTPNISNESSLATWKGQS